MHYRPHGRRRRRSLLKRLTRNPLFIVLAMCIALAAVVVICLSLGWERMPSEPIGLVGAPYPDDSGQKTSISGQPQNESKFVSELGKKSYPAVEPPAEPPLLRWEFSSKSVHNYDFEQRVSNRHDFGFSESRASTMNQAVVAELLMRSHGDGTADLVFRNLRAKAEIGHGGEKPLAMSMGGQTVVVQGIKEDGSMKTGNSNMGMLMKLMFPLPLKPLEVGQSVDIPGTIPFNAGGSLLHATGATKLTLTGYVKIREHSCARFKADIDISDMEVPKDLKGNYRFWNKGTGIFYFDIEDRCFARVELAMVMSIRAGMLMPDVSVDGEKSPVDMPEIHKASMDNDNLIIINRK